MDNVTLDSNGQRLLTVPQVADRLGISARKTWRLISQRVLPTVKVGERGTRIPAGDLDAYIVKLRAQIAR
jgi:excisionase family DNA binding protein